MTVKLSREQRDVLALLCTYPGRVEPLTLIKAHGRPVYVTTLRRLEELGMVVLHKMTGHEDVVRGIEATHEGRRRNGRTTPDA